MARRNQLFQNGMKAWAGGAIVLLLLLTPLLNYQVSQFQEASQVFTTSGGERTLASVDPSWELKVSEDAAQLLKDELFRGNARGGFASIGRKPTLYDRLAFGVLEGKYQFRLEEGKITEIDLVDADSMTKEARKLEDHESFLNEFKGLFLVSYEVAKERTRYLDQNNNVIVYDLLSGENSRVGQVSFVQDPHGGLQRIQLKRFSRSSSALPL